MGRGAAADSGFVIPTGERERSGFKALYDLPFCYERGFR
jgi:hypothetical protein